MTSWVSIAAAPPTAAKKRISVMLSLYSTPKTDFEQFIFFVRSAVTEFLNDAKQGSYSVLHDKWWRDAHDTILRMVDQHQLNNYGISAKFIENLMVALPADLLNEKQKNGLKEYIMQAYISYNAAIKRTCYCDDTLCMGDCGVRSCGCIDTCRCYSNSYSWGGQ